ncbi:MAG: TolC family protein, partial [Epsilonproteobacteria bacterium]|nr:TolC family protein [Campylobacterota bacterium]
GELVESGLNNNSAIKSNDLQTQLMEAKKSESKANRFGEVDAVGSYTHYNLPRTLAPIVPSSLSPNSSVETTKDLFTSGIQYSVPLFMGGALKEQVEIDKLAKSMTEMRAKLSREEIIYNIRSLYLSGLSLQELISAQNSYVDALKKLRAVIATSVEIGKKARIDLIKSDSSIKEAEGKVAQMESSLKMIKSTLKAITHISDIDYLEPIEVDMVREDNSVDEDFDNLDRFKLQNLEISKGDRVISKAKASKRPQIALNSYAGYNYDIDDNSPNKEYLWQVGVNLKWDVFDFGKSNARIQQAKIAKLQAIVKKEATTEGFKKLLAKAFNQIETALVDYQTNLSKLRLVQESQKIEEARYNAGVSTLNDLLLAKSKTQLTKSKLIESQYEYKNGVYYLDYLLERGENR